MDASGLWSFVFSINFQIREIPATKLHFSCEKKPIVVLVKISEKKKKKKKKKKERKKSNFFSGLRSCCHRQTNRKKLLPLKKYFKTLKDMTTCTAST